MRAQQKSTITLFAELHLTLLLLCSPPSWAGAQGDLFQQTDSFRCAELLTVIATPSTSSFHSPSNVFAQVMAESISKARPTIGNFHSLTRDLINARLEVNKKEWEVAIQKLSMNPHSEQLKQEMQRSLNDVNVISGFLRAPFHENTFISLYRLKTGSITTVEAHSTRYRDLFLRMRERANRKAPFRSDTLWEHAHSLTKDLFGRIKRDKKQVSLPLGSHRVIPFSVRNSSLGWQKRIHIEQNATGDELLLIVEYLEQLWRDILLSRDRAQSAKLIAEFEWWFIGTNPTGRAGASLGDALSLVLQKEKDFRLRQSFQHLDFDVLAAPDLDTYIEQRSSVLLQQ